MTPERLLQALALPASCLVHKRLPKTVLTEHGAVRAGDKQAIEQGVAAAHWLASIKPGSVGIAEHSSETRSYVELAVLHVELKQGAKASRLVQLLHAALPHPLLLLTSGALCSLSLVHKRIAPGNHRAVDGAVVQVQWVGDAEAEPYTAAFAAALGIGPRHALELPPADLAELYQRWIEAVEALLAARRIGRFGLPASVDEAANRRKALEDCARLEAEMARLRTTAQRERQLTRLATLNHELQAARTAHQQAQQAL